MTSKWGQMVLSSAKVYDQLQTRIWEVTQERPSSASSAAAGTSKAAALARDST